MPKMGLAVKLKPMVGRAKIHKSRPAFGLWKPSKKQGKATKKGKK